MSRKKILWLCSWYPGKTEPFNGDFIQRHAIAASLFNDIHVIHVAGDVSGSLRQDKEEEINRMGALTEQIIYFKRSSSFLGKLVAHKKWARLYWDAIKRYIVRNGMPDLVHVHVPVKAGLLAIRVKKKFGIPYVVTEHWTIFQPQNKIRYDEQKAFVKSILYWVVKHSRLLLPVSTDLGLLINKLVTKKEFLVVQNTANEEYFYYADKVRPGSTFRFIHVSNMTYQKNAEAIIDCFSRLQVNFPNVEFVIIGPVPEILQQQINKTGLLGKKIFLKGEITYAAVAAEMQQAHALVMFSRFENSPCSIIESLCCGIPVIATKVGGIPELLNSDNGILVEQGNEEGLLSGMQQMMDGYQRFNRERIAASAKEKFSYQSVGKQLDDVYNIILSRSKGQK